MRQLLSYHCQISMIKSKHSPQPKISGWEEIWCNGQRQIHHWNNQDSVMFSEIADNYSSDFLDNPWIGFDHLCPDEPVDSIETNYNKSSLRYINPNDVIIEPHHNASHQFLISKSITKVGKTISHGIEKLTKMAQKLPSVLTMAWRELNRND